MGQCLSTLSQKDFLTKIAQEQGFSYLEGRDILCIPLGVVDMAKKLQRFRTALQRYKNPIIVGNLCFFIIGDGFRVQTLPNIKIDPSARIGDYHDELFAFARSITCEAVSVFGSLGNLTRSVDQDVFFFIRAVTTLPTKTIDFAGLQGSLALAARAF
mmetsp:Transcript_11186/g.21309  ORF Transcript_11186/g.21309 Transcript_11186/m.21309 type:complete len:157 (+) Transcript_11186:1953-2423(+)